MHFYVFFTVNAGKCIFIYTTRLRYRNITKHDCLARLHNEKEAVSKKYDAASFIWVPDGAR